MFFFVVFLMIVHSIMPQSGWSQQAGKMNESFNQSTNLAMNE
jgi:hypothetical protein